MLNRKGFTIAEIIISFSMLTIILASVMAMTVFYRNQVKNEEVITQLVDFKNTITKAVYDDILAEDNRRIVSVNECVDKSNCINFVDKDDKSHVLEIVEIAESDENNKK